MPSLSYSRWTQFVGDPQDLLQRLQAALAVPEPDPYSLGRATIVSLAAAWETYVEHVAVETAQHLLSLPDLSQFQTQVNHFNNATAEKVEGLFTTVLGHSLWNHVAVTGRTVDETRLVVNANQNQRHLIAHGQSRPVFPAALLNERIAFFSELVSRVDQYLHSVLAAQLGYDPW